MLLGGDVVAIATGGRDVQVLTPVPGVTGATQIAAGDSFDLAITSAGNVWAWGNNQSGALGRGNVPPCSTCGDPQPPGLVLSDTLTGPLTGIDPGTDVTVSAKAIARLASGQQFSLAGTSAGTVVGWGADNRGQLGDNNNQGRNTPVTAIGLTRVVAVAAGLAHSLALTEQGTVYAWGYNGLGNLVLGDTRDRFVPTPVPGLPPIVAIAAGADHWLALDSTGQVWAWGFNADGELGDGTTVDRLTPEAGAQSLRGADRRRAELLDLHRHGQPGLDLGEQQLRPAGGGEHHPSLVPEQVPGLPGIAQIAAGIRQAYALDFQGHIYAWGSGQSGELGNGQSGLTAMLTSDHDFAAVAEILPADPASARATAYNLFRGVGSSTGVPRVERAGAAGVSTALLLMGVDAGPVQATVTYLDGIGTAIKSVTLTVPPKGVATADQSGDLAPGAIASAIVGVAAGGRAAVLEVGTGATGLTSVSLP